MRLRVLLFCLALAMIVFGLWSISRRSARRARPREVPIQDGRTIDFSSGKPVVKDDAKEKAAIAKGVSEMENAAGNVTFSPKAPAAPSK
jgi:hypothetical protein